MGTHAKRIKIIGGLLLLCILVVAITSGVFIYLRKHPTLLGASSLPKEEPRETRTELSLILADIRKVMLLTESETPTLATVTEAEKMKTQSFFKNAENGDKVIIYVASHKAILWRPSTKMIIEVGTVSKDNSTATTDAPPRVDLEKKVAIRATNAEKLATIVKKAKTIPGVQITASETSATTQYNKTLVIDLSGKRSSEAQLLAQILSATVGDLPSTEKAAKNADFLILVAQ